MDLTNQNEELKKNISLAINFIDVSQLELCDFKSESEQEKIKNLLEKFRENSAAEQKNILDEVS